MREATANDARTPTWRVRLLLALAGVCAALVTLLVFDLAFGR